MDENMINEHDFLLVSLDNGEEIARVWHSDQGEWTVDASDGATFLRARRQDAIDLVTAQYGEVYER